MIVRTLTDVVFVTAGVLIYEKIRTIFGVTGQTDAGLSVN
jgi:hypothetical protein